MTQVSTTKRLLADNLRSLRETHGFTQVEVAEAVGTDRATVSRCESSTVEYFPAPGIIDKFAHFYQVRHGDLFRVAGVADKNFSVVATVDTAMQIVMKHWDDLELKRRKK